MASPNANTNCFPWLLTILFGLCNTFLTVLFANSLATSTAEPTPNNQTSANSLPGETPEEQPLNLVLAYFSFCACFFLSYVLYWRIGNDDWGMGSVPVAEGGIPILGHALAYKADPPAFLRNQERAVGKVFRINLAGRDMIIIGSDKKAMKQVATLPASVMSSEQALKTVGFDYTLGNINTSRGASIHKRILRDEILGEKQLDSFVFQMRLALSNALDKEISHHSESSSTVNDEIRVPDLFSLVRRCILRASLDVMAGRTIITQGEEIITEIMNFQDSVEDATAKDAILPRFISLPLVLWSTQKKRERLEKELANRIRNSWDTSKKSQEKCGPWMKVFHESKFTPEEAASLVVGLMFAAHKNPAIGAAQSFCFLNDLGSESELNAARKEAKLLLRGSECNASLLHTQAPTLFRCVLETTRLTSHSLGALRYVKKAIVLDTESNNSYRIGTGETIAISHICSHRNEDIWENAENYDMNRAEWDLADKFGQPVDIYKMTAFSQGTHKCPGERVALVLMEIMLAALIDRDASLCGALPAVSFERATLAQRDAPVPIIFKKMSSN